MQDAVILLVGALCVAHTTRELLGLMARTRQPRASARRVEGEALTLCLDRRRGGRRSEDRRRLQVESAIGSSLLQPACAPYSSWDALQGKLSAR